MKEKIIAKINGPVVIAEGEADFAMHDIVRVRKRKAYGRSNKNRWLFCYNTGI